MSVATCNRCADAAQAAALPAHLRRGALPVCVDHDPTGGLATAATERAARIARLDAAGAEGGDIARWRTAMAELNGRNACDILSADLGGTRLYPARCGNPGEYVSGVARSGVMCEGHGRHFSHVAEPDGECETCECTGRITVVIDDGEGGYDGSAPCPDCRA